MLNLEFMWATGRTDVFTSAVEVRAAAWPLDHVLPQSADPVPLCRRSCADRRALQSGHVPTCCLTNRVFATCVEDPRFWKISQRQGSAWQQGRHAGGSLATTLGHATCWLRWIPSKSCIYFACCLQTCRGGTLARSAYNHNVVRSIT